MPFASRLAIWTLWLTVTCCATSYAQNDDDELRHGLIARYGAGNVRVERVDQSIAFDWGRDAPDARLDSSRFQVNWRGTLLSQSPGPYRLGVYSSGTVVVRLAGKVMIQTTSASAVWSVSEPVALKFGYHPLEIEFTANQSSPSRIGLFWSGPGFSMEPVGPRQLWHEPDQTPADPASRGESLVRANRCAACHHFEGASQPSPGPSLAQLPGNLREPWLRNWLASHEPSSGNDKVAERPARRMPHFKLTADELDDLVAFLMQPQRAPQPTQSSSKQKTAPDAGSAAAKKKAAAKVKNSKKKPRAPSAEFGREVFLQVGCLACHQWDGLGTATLFSGGDLTDIATKRPDDFFLRWLQNPARVNADHRMPRITLSDLERRDLSLWLAKQRSKSPDNALPAAQKRREKKSVGADQIARGREVFFVHRCDACHQPPAGTEPNPPGAPLALGTRSQWERSCTGAPNEEHPGLQFNVDDAQLVQNFIKQARRSKPRSPQSLGRRWLEENQCLSCHARELQAGLGPKLPAIAKRFPQFASVLPALSPPALTSIGDKLRREALHDAIQKPITRRKWLTVRMPQFRLQPRQLKGLVDYLVASDRVPEPAAAEPPPVTDTALLHGPRLVTTDGFGCTSCHQVGSVLPPKAPLNALGPDLSEMGKRIRYAWFDRWVRDPARIVPRMEMPSVKLAVGGVMEDNLNQQLAAVWHVLNRPGFEPPRPNPVRVVRRSATPQDRGRAVLVTDVIRIDGQSIVKPMLIGLPNRHNLLFNLGEARLVRWSLGDVARQRTEGKSWYWEAAGSAVVETGVRTSEFQLAVGQQFQSPIRTGQFVSELDGYEHVPSGLNFRHRLHFNSEKENDAPQTIRIEQRVTVAADSPRTAVRREVRAAGLRPGQRFQLRIASSDALQDARLNAAQRGWDLPSGSIHLLAPKKALLTNSGWLDFPQADSDGFVQVTLLYQSKLAPDQFPVTGSPIDPPQPQTLKVVPGYEVIRAPLADEMMPTALAWRPDGRLLIASLKGRVWLARDEDGDGLEDRAEPISDELAAPFGLRAERDRIDVVTKYGLLRLQDRDGDQRADTVTTLVSGWGHTTDYHDWTVGLPRDAQGNYYVATACQQDKRSPAAARWRGQVLKLIPRQPTADTPQRYSVEPVSGGHRFPIGIARNRLGQLFVTDNQGNYNPFNELNHVVPGARFGFLNALERNPGFNPPLTAPAIDIPHPWTRSVNGICFLETPPSLPAGRFGPFEGHLIGCEYDTRRLIRMSLEEVDGVIQGAAYPFTLTQPTEGPPLLGPLACAVSPAGDLYVGCIRDSGWGGANNIGSLVRIRPQGSLPAGIAEVRATPEGLRVTFTQPLDAQRLEDPKHYAVASYTRVSTPSYGGPDRDRRQETVRAAIASADRRSVDLRLAPPRAGYVYEVRLRDLVPEGEALFPAEAYYTMRRVKKLEARRGR